MSSLGDLYDWTQIEADFAALKADPAFTEAICKRSAVEEHSEAELQLLKKARTWATLLDEHSRAKQLWRKVEGLEEEDGATDAFDGST